MKIKRILFYFVLAVIFSKTMIFAKSKTTKFNQYIWKDIPGMDYYKVLAQVSIPENPDGTVVIICPGGSYHHLDIFNEGYTTQKWFNRQGATAIVLWYRTAGKNFHQPAMQQDVQRTIQLIRENPDLYKADSQKVGLIGFSAGGHLVTWAAAFGNRNNTLEKLNIKTEVSLQPDFVIPVYPVVTMNDDIGHKWSRKSLLGKTPSSQEIIDFSMEKQIPQDMPPVYLVACKDDSVVIFENSERLYSALQQSQVDCEFAVYEWGGHGFGMKNNAFMKTFRWNEPLLGWLQNRNFCTP